ncbi:hypothetical protein ACMU_07370 [Actibacterium mucosum KCTC 23349]|uniref:NADH:ubiquinone reductase (non-electrogenic) n=2 Tax=Actibacterium TaxID=1433986 RepID=A0A037ZM75_9RHOB|nr:hypothetical protein ACMU_07370 [Actibacterium mucosum KCTC 23349]
MAALRLAGKGRKHRFRVALINPRKHFVERLRLHETVRPDTDTQLRSFCLQTLCGKQGISFYPGQVTRIDREALAITVDQGDIGSCTLNYQRLVLATGSSAAAPDLRGANHHCYVMDSNAERGPAALQRAIGNLSAPRINIVGGGTTGIELAAELAQHPGADVHLVTTEKVGKALHPRVGDHVRRTLLRKGVRLHEHTPVKEVFGEQIETDRGTLPHDIVIAASGFSTFNQWPGLDLNRASNGRICTDPFLRAPQDKRIFVVGDAALPDLQKTQGSAPARMSVFFALASGAHAADVILDERAGRVPRRFAYWTYGQAVGLGDEAIGYGTMRFDQAYRPFFVGKTGAAMRRFFISVLYQLIMLQARWPSLPFFLGRPLRGAGRLWQPAAQTLGKEKTEAKLGAD